MTKNMIIITKDIHIVMRLYCNCHNRS